MANKKQKIKKDTNIADAIEINPQAAHILAMSGVGCVGCAMSNIETIGRGLEAHGFEDKEIDKIIKELNESLEKR